MMRPEIQFLLIILSCIFLERAARIASISPPTGQFDSVAYIAVYNKVLLRRARDEDNQDSKSVSPEEPEFYLLDVATGRTQKVAGEFAPLLQEGRRSLQPAGKQFEYWAAVPDRENNRELSGIQLDPKLSTVKSV